MSDPDANPADAKPADNPFAEMVRNPAARTYLMLAAAGLLVACSVQYLFQQNGPAAAAVFIFGAAGLALRWVIGPPAVVVVICYFSFFPVALPIQVSGGQVMLRQSEPVFLFTDLLLTASALVYLIGSYRFHSVMRAGMPFDAPALFVKPGVKPTVRPAVPVRDAELWSLFARVGAVVLVGQLLWLFATKLKLDFRRLIPLRPFNDRLEESGYTYNPATGTVIDPDAIPNQLSRFLLVAGAVLSVVFVLWFVFWYWRLAVMNRDEARAVCLDTQWTTARREYNRPEKWRGWMKQKAAGTLPKKGCGAFLLVVGLPALMVFLALMLLGCAGAFG
jgi:hypothetical protein